jgi:HEAT repeat protein
VLNGALGPLGDIPKPNDRTRWARDIEPRPVEWVPGLPNYVPRRVVTLITGQRDIGKSNLMTWLAGQVTRRGGHVWINSLEDDLHSVVRPRLEVVGADLGRVRVSNDRLRLPGDLGRLQDMLRRHVAEGARDDLVVLDSLQRHVPKYVSSEAASEAFEGLRQLAEDFFLGFLVIRQAPIQVAMDAESIGVLSRAMRSTDVRERRLAFQLLADLPAGTGPPELAEGVDDEDPLVRLAAIKALDLSSPSGQERIHAMIDDSEVTVAAAAAARSLSVTDGGRASSRIHELLGSGDERVRRANIEQLVLAPSDQAGELASVALDDHAPSVRAAALEVVAATAPDRVLDRAIVGLRDPDPAVRFAAGRALGAAGSTAVDEVLDALGDRQTADAAVEAVRRVELNGGGDRVRAFIRTATESATRDHILVASIPVQDDAVGLLRDAILDRGRRTGRSALWAATMLGGRRVEMEIAIENLDGPPEQVATALETLETAGDQKLLRPLLALWDPAAPSAPESDWLPLALGDRDEFIRRCAEFVRAQREGGGVPTATLSVTERVLFLRKVPLFADVSPQDLERLAELVEERGYADGEVIASEGEIGDEEWIVIEGAIRVVQDRGGREREVARRGVGEVVGGLSLLRRAPRIASLVADGAVRTICISYRDVESILRERPEIAMAAMRVLADRLAEASGGEA